MTDLTVKIGKLTSINPFWLASSPITNTGNQIMKAFDLGWGGAVWKTIGSPVINLTSRLSCLKYNNAIIGINNIELISDRSNDINFKEMSEVKKRFPNNLLISSLMASKNDDWLNLTKRSFDSGADAIEMNLSCPHGMCERGMGDLIGQSPLKIKEVVSFVTSISKIPVFVKLTPNITNILDTYDAAVESGCYGVSLINTIKSITGVNLDNFVPFPNVDGNSTNGGYCGPAVKPIALYYLSQVCKYGKNKPISGIGGISTWQDAVEFLLLGASSLQLCTEVMKKGYRIIDGLISGLSNFLISKDLYSVEELIGKSIEKYKKWNELNINYKIVAKINNKNCIKCKLCYIACYDSAHQCINIVNSFEGENIFVDENLCVGCNLCSMVCPVINCITMEKK